MKMRHLMTLAEARRQYYVRFGDLPANGRSAIGAAPNWMKAMQQTDTHETGVSVYPIKWSDEMQRWEIDCNNYASLSELLAQKRPAYMVTGDPVTDEDGYEAYGMDDEPLLTNVRIVQNLPYDKLWAPAWGEMPEEFLDIGTDPDWLNTDWSEQDRRKAYAKSINHTLWSGHVMILHPDGRVQDYGNKKVGRGDLMLMMGGFDLTQGPVDVTYRDQKWRMFWLNGMHEENKPINLLASELLGRSTAVFRGAVALLQTTDRIDERLI